MLNGKLQQSQLTNIYQIAAQTTKNLTDFENTVANYVFLTTTILIYLINPDKFIMAALNDSKTAFCSTQAILHH